LPVLGVAARAATGDWLSGLVTTTVVVAVLVAPLLSVTVSTTW
jgi:hypothetical protein